MKTKKILMIASIIAIFALFYNFFPLILIAGCVIFVVHKNKKLPEQKPKPRPRIVEEPNNHLAIQATMQEARQVINKHNDIIRGVDLRQFKGRTDVTKEELATYMFEQQYWNGAYERKTIMEEIVKHCNLTMEDVDWCMENLRHYKFENDPYHEFKACTVYSEENKTIAEYENEQQGERIKGEIKKLITEHKQNLEFIKQDDLNGEMAKMFTEQFNESLKFYVSELRKYDYNTWLRMKGFIK